jgi:hypothetical protein
MSDPTVSTNGAPASSNVIPFTARKRPTPDDPDPPGERDHHEDAMSMLETAIELASVGDYGRALNMTGLAENALKRASERIRRP